MSFETVKTKDFSFISFAPWSEKGIRGGFCGADLNFAADYRAASARKFCMALGVKTILLPRQTHSDGIWELIASEGESLAGAPEDFYMPGEECDALVVRRKEGPPGGKIAIGVLTADCVPLLIKAKGYSAVVHAGWRGLANGIISKALKGAADDAQVCIGPCAGPDLYEVGREVIDQIGEQAIYKRSARKDAFILNLTETAGAIIRKDHPVARVFSAGICTISNTDFNSFRRDGKSSGRNLSFLVL